MSIRLLRHSVSVVAAALTFFFLAGCGGGDKALTNSDPGGNDLNVVVAFGDSITQGSECPCVPYPARLQGLIEKTVFNAGIGGSRATANIGRTQDVINQYHPAFMFILYGVNDVIHSEDLGSILSAINQMVFICKQNHVVPVLMTYPMPINGHALFAGGTLRLNDGIRQIAEAEELELVDLENEFSTGPDPVVPDLPMPDGALYMPDGLHPNDAGTQIMALACADLF